jgi:protein-S-isoprenylcysteine O-methyltransferase Ste14
MAFEGWKPESGGYTYSALVAGLLLSAVAIYFIKLSKTKNEKTKRLNRILLCVGLNYLNIFLFSGLTFSAPKKGITDSNNPGWYCVAMLIQYFWVNVPMYVAFTMLTAGWNKWGGKPGCCAGTAIKTWLAKNILCYIILVSLGLLILISSYWHVKSPSSLPNFEDKLITT